MAQRLADRFYRYDKYTESALEDEFTFLLLSYNECVIELDEVRQEHIVVYHLYINQADGLLYKINIYDPVPEFVIWTSHIPYDLALALQRLGKVTMNQVITNAVRRIYETVDPEYYFKNGIYGKVKWRFGKE